MGKFYSTKTKNAPLSFRLGEGSMLTGFEEQLLGMQIKESKAFTLGVENAYGPKRNDLVFKVNKGMLPKGYRPVIGQKLNMKQPDGSSVSVTINRIADADVTVDANHPLAGSNLHFEVEILEIS